MATVISTSLRVSFVSDDEKVHSLTYDNMRSGLTSSQLSGLVQALEAAGHLFSPTIAKVSGLTLITKTETDLEVV